MTLVRLRASSEMFLRAPTLRYTFSGFQSLTLSSFQERFHRSERAIKRLLILLQAAVHRSVIDERSHAGFSIADINVGIGKFMFSSQSMIWMRICAGESEYPSSLRRRSSEQREVKIMISATLASPRANSSAPGAGAPMFSDPRNRSYFASTPSRSTQIRGFCFSSAVFGAGAAFVPSFFAPFFLTAGSGASRALEHRQSRRGRPAHGLGLSAITQNLISIPFSISLATLLATWLSTCCMACRFAALTPALYVMSAARICASKRP